jgi:L-lactate dehydrogenase complex protein LldG
MMENRANSQNSSAARDDILASVRRSLALSEPFHKEHHRIAEPSVESVKRSEPIGLDELVEHFRSNLESVGGHFTEAANEKAASVAIRKIVDDLGSRLIAVSDSNLVKRVAADAGLDVVENASRKFLFDSDLGITAAQWGIAETGTLVLESDVESHRLTSLVPPVHLCLLSAGDIRQSLGEILEMIGGEPSRTITFITGASRTSDIELTLAIGVHGPRELHVIVIADS